MGFAETQPSKIVQLTNDSSPEDADVVDGAVVIVGLRLLDAVDDVEALGDFAEDGVLAVEVGHTALLTVEVEQLVGHGDTMVGLRLDLIANLIELLGGVGLSPDDIELTAAGTAFGILAVALACRRQRPTLVGMQQTAFAREELSLDGIVGTPLAQRDTGFGMTAVGVATLNHEVLDDTVEEQRVVELLIDEFQEVVAMTRGMGLGSIRSVLRG